MLYNIKWGVTAPPLIYHPCKGREHLQLDLSLGAVMDISNLIKNQLFVVITAIFAFSIYAADAKAQRTASDNKLNIIPNVQLAHWGHRNHMSFYWRSRWRGPDYRRMYRPTFWTGWRTYYYRGLYCKKTCLIDRWSRVVIRCKKRCRR